MDEILIHEHEGMKVSMIDRARTLADHARDFLAKAIEKWGYRIDGYSGLVRLCDDCDRWPYVGLRGGALERVDDDGYMSELDDMAAIQAAIKMEDRFVGRGVSC